MHLGEHMVHNPRHFEEKLGACSLPPQKKVTWSKALFLLKCRTHVVEGSFNDNIIEAHTRHLKYPSASQCHIVGRPRPRSIWSTSITIRKKEYESFWISIYIIQYRYCIIYISWNDGCWVHRKTHWYHLVLILSYCPFRFPKHTCKYKGCPTRGLIMLPPRSSRKPVSQPSK